MMVNHHEREWKQIAGIASDRDQLYLAHAQRSMKKRVTGGRKRPLKSLSAQHPNGRIVHSEHKRGQSCGCAGACMHKCNNVHAQECEHNKHDVRARACLHASTHTVASRMCTCKKKRPEEGQQSARLGSSLSVCECACMCKHSHFKCTCHNVRMSGNTNVNMYENAQVYKNKRVCQKPTTCGIKAGICMCTGIQSTHGYAWYGRACTAPCTCNVVCMCGKIRAQESEKNSNHMSNKIIRLGKYGSGRNVCQEACRKAVGRATCMCVSNWETVVVTMSVRAIAIIVARGQAATQTTVTLPGASQS